MIHFDNFQKCFFEHFLHPLIRWLSDRSSPEYYKVDGKRGQFVWTIFENTPDTFPTWICSFFTTSTNKTNQNQSLNNIGYFVDWFPQIYSQQTSVVYLKVEVLFFGWAEWAHSEWGVWMRPFDYFFVSITSINLYPCVTSSGTKIKKLDFFQKRRLWSFPICCG